MMGQFDYYFTASDGTKIRYIDRGEGKALVFPHGFGCCADDSAEQFEILSKQFRCISFDQRGYGGTPLTKNAGLQQSAKDMHELIAHLKLDKIVLVGYSMGAAVLFAYIARFGCEYLEKVLIGDMSPKVVNDGEWKLGLYQGWYTMEDVEKDAGFLTPEEAEARNLYFMEQLLLPHTPEEERRYITPDKDPEGYAALKAKLGAAAGLTLYNERQIEANRYYTRSMGEADFREVLPHIHVPALLVYAVPGSLYWEGVGRYMEAHVPGSRLLLIKNATHAFTPEQNRQYRQALIDFAAKE